MIPGGGVESGASTKPRFPDKAYGWPCVASRTGTPLRVLPDARRHAVNHYAVDARCRYVEGRRRARSECCLRILDVVDRVLERLLEVFNLKPSDGLYLSDGISFLN
jgi:hypothetical protein